MDITPDKAESIPNKVNSVLASYIYPENFIFNLNILSIAGW